AVIQAYANGSNAAGSRLVSGGRLTVHHRQVAFTSIRGSHIGGELKRRSDAECTARGRYHRLPLQRAGMLVRMVLLAGPQVDRLSAVECGLDAAHELACGGRGQLDRNALLRFRIDEIDIERMVERHVGRMVVV